MEVIVEKDCWIEISLEDHWKLSGLKAQKRLLSDAKKSMEKKKLSEDQYVVKKKENL